MLIGHLFIVADVSVLASVNCIWCRIASDRVEDFAVSCRFNLTHSVSQCGWSLLQRPIHTF